MQYEKESLKIEDRVNHIPEGKVRTRIEFFFKKAKSGPAEIEVVVTSILKRNDGTFKLLESSSTSYTNPGLSKSKFIKIVFNTVDLLPYGEETLSPSLDFEVCKTAIDKSEKLKNSFKELSKVPRYRLSGKRVISIALKISFSEIEGVDFVEIKPLPVIEFELPSHGLGLPVSILKPISGADVLVLVISEDSLKYAKNWIANYQKSMGGWINPSAFYYLSEAYVETLNANNNLKVAGNQMLDYEGIDDPIQIED